MCVCVCVCVCVHALSKVINIKASTKPSLKVYSVSSLMKETKKKHTYFPVDLFHVHISCSVAQNRLPCSPPPSVSLSTLESDPANLARELLPVCVCVCGWVSVRVLYHMFPPTLLL